MSINRWEITGRDECEDACPHCNNTGLIAIRSRDGTYAFPGPVPDDAKGYAEEDCWRCNAARAPRRNAVMTNAVPATDEEVDGWSEFLRLSVCGRRG